jgi:putative hydrolases of HD superfamily
VPPQKTRARASPNGLIGSAGKLKRIKRKGWVKKVGIKNPESVAEHSFRMAVLGAYASEILSLDPAKVMRMCLIHDLAESVIGDKMPEEKKSEESHRDEEDRVMLSILGTLPEPARRKFISDWKELVEDATLEAKAVWQIDKLEMGLQMKDYAAQGYSKEKLSQFDPARILTRYWRKMLMNYKPRD